MMEVLLFSQTTSLLTMHLRRFSACLTHHACMHVNPG